MNLDILGYIAATLTTAAFAPQAIRSIRTRDTTGMSLWMYVMFTIGVAFWLAYGIATHSWPMIVANAVTLPLAGSILVLKLRHG
jgi:MtN3 and saliva related transmembrane protein